MAVTLRVTRYLDAEPALCMDCRFDRLGGTLGRSADNDMVFEDPDKSISRLHARIEFHDGAYCLLDMGANPSLVNEQAVGIGRRVRLTDGDLIRIGHYQLMASVEPEAAAPMPCSLLQAPAAVNPPAALFASSDDALATESILIFDGDIAEPSALNAPWPQLWTEPVAPSYSGTRSDHVPPERAPFEASFEAPAPVGETHMTIPDDYDPMAGILQPEAPLCTALPILPEPGVASDDPVVRALLRGLGLPEQLTGTRAEEFAELAGSMLRAATAGTMAALMARAATRRESRLGMAMIAAPVDNPLASLPDVETALTRMLSVDMPGAMTPAEAYAHAFDEIDAHEGASMAGMRAALSGVLACFDPAAIELRVGKPTPMEKLFAARRKARLWDRMVALNAQLAGDAEEEFQRLFAQAFGWKFEQARTST